MSRTLAALAALTLIAGAARAADEVDPKTQAAIQSAVDKAVGKAEERLRADVQTSQASAEIDAAVAPGPKLQFIELDGYLRVRGDMYDDLDLDSGMDAAGRYLFPIPLRGNPSRGTLAGANMRLRLEPTLNVSEQVRVRAQVDVLDNYAFGSSSSVQFDQSGSPYPVPFYGSSRSFLRDTTRTDRDAILVKRAWGEVQTPAGLLSFGRMPAGWGLGILQNPGGGIDDDYGDTVDRIQFALPPVTTPVGPLTVVPSLDFDSEGVQRFDPLGGRPIDADNADDARSWGLKLARVDTDDELRRKLDKGEASLNYGAFYQYKAQVWTFPGWDATTAATGSDTSAVSEKRSAYAHVLDLWTRWQRGAFKVEAEAAGIFGHVGNANAAALDASGNPVGPSGDVLIRQLGVAATFDWALLPKKLTLGAQAGFASGDDAPGFGNDTSAEANPSSAYGTLQGAQWGTFGGVADRSIRNFRFNPAYRVDVILFRQILGGVTDAWYLKPTAHWDLFPGLAIDGAIVYSSAVYGESTPSSTGPGTGKKALGVEGDAKVTYTSGDGFQAWIEYGILQPFDALKTVSDVSLARAHALHVGLAARF
ncbi:MAG TPA: TIGR04551 family protein [Anaeromyxobacteraceae bacterium]|nr:TIGR04551 family protein [Anaeromyxobacteraceae bacterium]